MKEIEMYWGVVHQLPEDIKSVLEGNKDLLSKRNKLTPLARNEWICRVTIVKQEKTREEHIKRLEEDILNWKRRPCCWPGCPHRRETAKKWFKWLD